jgi:cytochrome P450
MSESSFGGSFGLVRHGHHPLKTRITKYMKKAALFQTVPLLNLVSTPRDEELDATVQSILDKRLHTQKLDGRKDLLQILLEASFESPDTLSEEHIKAEMFVFL